ncbi:MAG: hypothetical protein LBT79_03625 [Elusimicrobiota bacterium]|jgi:hypothetical protein|nr:hypothetical protein [Elusimicrobiota bacterium]
MHKNTINITASQFITEVAETGKQYKFKGLHSVSIEDPTMNHITRGADGLDSSGIEYSEGNASPKTVTNAVRTTQNFYPLFKKFYQEQTRLNIYITDRKDGRVVFLKDAIIQQLPIQRDISESEDSCVVNFVFESFNLDADYKGGADFK